MDAGTFIPDSWVSRFLDISGGIMLVLMKSAHGKFEKQSDLIERLSGEHNIFKTDIQNMKEDIGEIKADGKEMRNDIKQLLRRH